MKHHTVPQFLLRKFQSDNKDLFYFNKRTPHKDVTHKNPDNIFCEKHGYSRRPRRGAPDPALETDYFQKLDSDAAKLVEAIELATSNGSPPSFSRTEKDRWDEFFLQMWQRSKEVRDELFPFSSDDDAINCARDENGWAKCEEDFMDKLDPNWRKKVRRNAEVEVLDPKNLIGTSMHQQIQHRKILVAKVIAKEKVFAIGSNPHCLAQLSLNHKKNNGPRPWLPISSTLATSFQAPNDHADIIYVSNHSLIRRFNEQLYAQSNEIASGSRELIEKLSRLDRRRAAGFRRKQ